MPKVNLLQFQLSLAVLVAIWAAAWAYKNVGLWARSPDQVALPSGLAILSIRGRKDSRTVAITVIGWLSCSVLYIFQQCIHTLGLCTVCATSRRMSARFALFKTSSRNTGMSASLPNPRSTIQEELLTYSMKPLNSVVRKNLLFANLPPPTFKAIHMNSSRISTASWHRMNILGMFSLLTSSCCPGGPTESAVFVVGDCNGMLM